MQKAITAHEHINIYSLQHINVLFSLHHKVFTFYNTKLMLTYIMRTMQQKDAASWCFSRTGSTLAEKENHVMVRLNLSNYTVPYIILSQGIPVKMPKESSPKMMKKYCGCEEESCNGQA